MWQRLSKEHNRSLSISCLLIAFLAIMSGGAAVASYEGAQKRTPTKSPAAQSAKTDVASSKTTAPSPEWPQWGGPHRNFKCPPIDLPDSWPDGGPKQLWSRTLGDGHSAIVVDNGKLYTMYSRGDQEFVIAVEAATGKTFWEHTYGAPRAGMNYYEQGYGPHSTPLIIGDLIYAVGATGKFHFSFQECG